MRSTRLYLLRHGEVHNPKEVLYGRLPRFSLTKQGRKKIEDTALYFYREKINNVYTSPMLRARQTAKILANKLKLNPKISKLVTEVRFVFAGIPLVEFRKTIQPKLYGPEYIKEGSEGIEEIKERMLRFLDIIKKRHEGQKILVVSHGDPIVILKAAIEGNLFTWEYKKNNYLSTGEWFKFNI